MKQIPVEAEDEVKQVPWQIGALVRLKSGGPLMTIMNADCVDVECWWFDGPKCNRREFHRKIIEPGEKGDDIPY